MKSIILVRSVNKKKRKKKDNWNPGIIYRDIEINNNDI